MTILLFFTVACVPAATAAPVPGSGNCTGDGKADPNNKWESCWGIHYNDAGHMDCVGQYLDTYAQPDKCVGVSP